MPKFSPISYTGQGVAIFLDKIKCSLKSKFSRIQQNFDNGVEFLDPLDMEASRYKGKNKRMDVFYAHPYASYERGTNENHNGLIRRFLPKGTKMEDVSEEKVAEIQHWLNNLPRRILGGKTPIEAFLEGLSITDENDLAKIAWLIVS